ncbi:hypothetical protein MTR_3g053040 [Medicago truncatula]|uniref:Uncharacterized protein n=1 Tax=Medicago truncatula TaxID=3880 RepID=A0A072UWD0_MEDTR|nr:hypothetical protein MTR_3g053040 [Medicago truncatula]
MAFIDEGKKNYENIILMVLNVLLRSNQTLFEDNIHTYNFHGYTYIQFGTESGGKVGFT